MAYVDIQTIHNPATGTIAPAAWGDQIRDNFEFLIDPPTCSVFNSAAQLVGTATLSALLANSENFDNDAMHSTASNTSRITIQTAGRYFVTAATLFAANGTGRRALDIRVNGVTTYNITTAVPNTTNSHALTGGRLLVLAAGDYVECMVLQSSGGALDVTLNEFGAVFLTR